MTTIPVITQSDPSTENFGVANMHTSIRHHMDPSLRDTLQHAFKQNHQNIKSKANWHKVLPHGEPLLICNKPESFGVYDYKISISPELLDEMELEYAPPNHESNHADKDVDEDGHESQETLCSVIQDHLNTEEELDAEAMTFDVLPGLRPMAEGEARVHQLAGSHGLEQAVFFTDDSSSEEEGEAPMLGEDLQKNLTTIMNKHFN
ncbi:hypothetical protein DXG01_004882 [Tephrocybe rancida]|nr:hypothetical protein DXG01_004882 [Tephrocybe rancida]